MTTSTAPPAPLPNARVALYNFVQDRLLAAQGTTLAAFILERRRPDNQLPYRRIANELIEITGIDVTHEAIRRWYHRAVESGGDPQATADAVTSTQVLHPAHAAALASPFAC